MTAVSPGPHWIDMKSMCQSLLEQYAERAERQHVTIDLSLGSDAATVIGDRDRLRAAIERLMDRALRAMPDGGELSLRVDRDSSVIVECADTGGDDTAGGAPAVAATIADHGGCLWRRRQPGGGTCFVVELRAAGPRRVRHVAA